MKLSFTVEISRQPSVKKLIKQLDEVTDAMIENMNYRNSIQPQVLVDDGPLDDLDDLYPNATLSDQDRLHAAPSRRIQIPVTDGNEPAQKPPTKAQQRRANTKKGLGPLTDEEVREQKNAKRRSERAAKKVAQTQPV